MENFPELRMRELVIFCEGEVVEHLLSLQQKSGK
jgi:hypothetical protein